MFGKQYIRRIVMGFAAAALVLMMAPVGAEAAVYDSEVPGSVLIFPKFDISDAHQTYLRIKNLSGLTPQDVNEITLHYYYVCPSCDSANRIRKFTSKDAEWINVRRDNPPCEQGYVIAWAESVFPAGVRIPHNYLIGDATIVKGADRSSYDAIAIQSPLPQGIPTTDLNGNGGLDFDGNEYAQVPQTSYFDFWATRVNTQTWVATQQSLVTLLSLDVNSGQENETTNVDFSCYDDKEVPFSANYEFHCWAEVPLTYIDAMFYRSNLRADHGWCEVRPATGETMTIMGLIEDETYTALANEGSLTNTIATGHLRSTAARGLSHDARPLSTLFTP